LQDPNWNVTAIADAAGVIRERYQYTAYGVRSILTPGFLSASGTNFDWSYAFTGRPLDLATGQYDFRKRHFAPFSGRFLGQDPTVYGAGDVNLYRYVLGRPVVATDPLGTGGNCPCTEDEANAEKKRILADANALKQKATNCPILKTNSGGSRLGNPDDPSYNMCEEQATQLANALTPQGYRCWEFGPYNGRRTTLNYFHWSSPFTETWNLVIVKPIRKNPLPPYLLDPFWGYHNENPLVTEQSLEDFHNVWNQPNDYGYPANPMGGLPNLTPVEILTLETF
jgi:RHS repeat-associated protein